MARAAGAVNYNERAWAIDLIGYLKGLAAGGGQPVQDAGGELTVSTGNGSLFPDVLLFGDRESARILQGWELKMPDTSVDDFDFIDNARDKANHLGLDSFLLWNVKQAVLYVRQDDDTFVPSHRWDDLIDIQTRGAARDSRARWEEMASKILAYINDLFARGTLEGRQFVDAYRSGGITELILQNSPTVAPALSDAAQADAQLRSEITVWWRQNKVEYGANFDKFSVLAQTVLSDWVGKFLFAHILQGTREEAHVVSRITVETTPQEALEIFETLSTQCNFYTIFGPRLGSAYLSDRAWSDLCQLNMLLSNLRLGSIDQAQISSLVEGSAEVSKRRLKGQYPTPATLARLLVGLCIEDIPQDRVLDPCAGSGTIPRAALEMKLQAGVGGAAAAAAVVAGDFDPQVLQMATFALAKPEIMNQPIRVYGGDAFALSPEMQIPLRDPNNGRSFDEEIGEFDVIVSNLPFISQDGRRQYGNAIANVNEMFEESGPITGRADIAAYLPFALHDLLRQDGKLGVVITNAWLGSEWGRQFYDRLEAFYHLETVVTSGAGRWFQNAKVVTNLLIMSPRDGEPNDEDQTDFVTLLQPLEELAGFEEIEEVSALIRLGQATDDVISVHSVTREQLRRARTLGLSGTAQFAAIDWILDFPLAPVSRSFAVERGERRGWNPMFYPASGHGIEPDYIQPVVKRPSRLDSYWGEPDAEAFCCSRTIEQLQREGATGTLAWIDRFRTATNGTGKPLPEALEKPGLHWYEMSADARADLAMPLAPNLRFFVAKFAEPTFVDQRIVRLTALDGTDTDLCAALLNSAVSFLMVEGMGFGRGEGVLDLNVTTLKRYWHMLDPSQLSPVQREAIVQAYAPLLERPVEDIADELERQDRMDFDECVLSSFNIEVSRQSIYDELLRLVDIRQTAIETFE